jgi:branched-chain amino acid aminotransferase
MVLEIAAEEEFPVEEGRYAVEDLRAADEAFLTNTTWEVRPVASVDGIDVGGGPMTELLRRLYCRRIEERCY